jgi:hypothetical protein
MYDEEYLDLKNEYDSEEAEEDNWNAIDVLSFDEKICLAINHDLVSDDKEEVSFRYTDKELTELLYDAGVIPD